jgi:hypothetical protein
LKNKDFRPDLVKEVLGIEFTKSDQKKSIREVGVVGTAYIRPGKSCYSIKKKYSYK